MKRLKKKPNNKNDKNKDKGLKRFLGMPMRWNKKKVFHNLWDKDDNRVFPPKYFGIGWTINFHALFLKLGLLDRKKK